MTATSAALEGLSLIAARHGGTLGARIDLQPGLTCGTRTFASRLSASIRRGWSLSPTSGFTLLFDALAMTLIIHMPVAAAARMLGYHHTNFWRVAHHYVERAPRDLDLSASKRVCVDETAAKLGHTCITLFIDIDARKVVFIAEGRGAGAVAQFPDWVHAHNCDAARIEGVCIDVSGADIGGVAEKLTEAETTFEGGSRRTCFSGGTKPGRAGRRAAGNKGGGRYRESSSPRQIRRLRRLHTAAR